MLDRWTGKDFGRKVDKAQNVAETFNAFILVPVNILLLITLIITIIQLTGIDFEGLEESIDRVAESNRFQIVSPVAGQEVSVAEMAFGRTPFLEKNNYVVVTPLETGDDFVQGGPLQVSADGSWTRKIQFGGVGLGCGERYGIRVIATSALLDDGALPEVPDDALTSNPTVVKRECQ